MPSSPPPGFLAPAALAVALLGIAALDARSSVAASGDRTARAELTRTGRCYSTALVVPLLFVVGLGLVADGFRRWRRARVLEDTPTEPVRAVAAGQTEVTGTAEPIGEPLARPFSSGECVLAEWRIEEYEDGDWWTAESGLHYAPFVVDDGTGRIEVQPVPDLDLRVADGNETEITVGLGDEEPPQVVDFLEEWADLETPASFLGLRTSRRYSARVIPAGETVYVFGGAYPRRDARGSDPDDLVLARDDDTGALVVSDRPKEAVVTTDRLLAPAEILAGIALAAAILWIVLAATL